MEIFLAFILASNIFLSRFNSCVNILTNLNDKTKEWMAEGFGWLLLLTRYLWSSTVIQSVAISAAVFWIIILYYSWISHPLIINLTYNHKNKPVECFFFEIKLNYSNKYYGYWLLKKCLWKLQILKYFKGILWKFELKLVVYLYSTYILL